MGGVVSESFQTHEYLNISDRLDKNHATKLYWPLSLMATIGGFLFGYDTANIGSVLGFVPYHLSSFALGYLVAGTSLGAAIGAIASGPVTDKFGRKSLLIIDAAIYAIGALVSAFTINSTMLLFSRTLIGLAIGADSAIATAYISEYAPKDRRGRLAILQQWMITIGILLAYLVAIIIYKLVPHLASSFDWRLILGLGAIPAIIGLALRFRMPESPRWLLNKGHYEKLRRTLSILGIQVDLQDIKRAAAVAKSDPKPVKAKMSPGVKKALFIASIFMIFQQITGINIPFYYGPKILGPFFTHPHMTAVNSAVGGIEATVVLAVVNVAATYIGFHFIDKAGRKSLSRTGFAGMAVFMLLSAASISFLTGSTKAILLVLSLSGFIIFFAFGVGGTGWIIQGEYFPTQVRGRMAATVAFVDWIANFVIIELFPVMKNNLGLMGTMIVFAILSILAVVFISTKMPETKGLSVEEISVLFQNQAVGKQ